MSGMCEGQVRTGQDKTGKVRTGQVWNGQIWTVQVGMERLNQVGTGTIKSGHAKFCQDRLTKALTKGRIYQVMLRQVKFN